MTGMEKSLDIATILDRVVSHALALGTFERVNGHEPLNPPGHGLSAGIWAQNVAPVRRMSGLAATSSRLELGARIYSPLNAQAPDATDPELLAATDDLLRAYSGDFTLDGAVEQVDLLGAYGAPLGADAGYLTVGDTTYRVMTITLPLIVTDLWEQVA